MENKSTEKKKKQENPQHYKLRKAIGNAFQKLRKNAGYTSSEKFANAKKLNRGMYGRYEAGSVGMKITTLLDNAVAHGLTDEDVFNKDFLALGRSDEENALTEKSINHLVDQLRHQVKLVSSEAKAYSLDDNDIKDLHNMLVAGWSPLSKRELFKKIGLNSKTPRFENILEILKGAGWMTMTNLKNLNDPGQKYYTTQVGKDALAAYEPSAARPDPLP
ncbi:hypothetical protein ACFOET_05795 [Parapedobacter deserti]|uniref:HTH cro/C1-type domain-containing protein n=1 Tax=Parapedobacter deserti TaxID=1912957 RepID=A0ABV7JGA2_9SPHI